MKLKKLIFNFLILFFISIQYGYAQTEIEEKVSKLSDEGYSLAKEGKFLEAIVKFKEAFALKENPVLLFNIGRCYEKLNAIETAIEYYKKYTMLESDINERNKIEEKIRELENKIYGFIKINVTENGARILLDNIFAGISPLGEMKIKQGEHKIQILKDGFKREERNFAIKAGERKELFVELQAGLIKEKEQPHVEIVKKEEKKTNILPYIAFGLSAGLIGGGAYLQFSAKNDRDKINNAEKDEEVIIGIKQMEADSLEKRANTKDTIAYIFYGVSAASLAGGIFLLLLPDSDDKSSSVTISPFPVKNGGGFTWSTSW